MEKFEKLKSELRDCHDRIKNHQFRKSFEPQYIKSYKTELYELSRIWGRIIYDVQHETEEIAKKYRDYGWAWIHDFRARLRTYDNETFPMDLFDYYEQILQCTHIYLDTGYFDVVYNPGTRFKNGERFIEIDKFEWLTEENTGLSSPILPRYICTNIKYCVDDDVVLEAFKKYSKNYEKLFEKWKNEEKHIYEYVNNNYHKNSDSDTISNTMMR